MNLTELCKWLRSNSSGVYRPAAEAANQIERLAEALTDIMDGMDDHEIPAQTGLCKEDCERISKARAEARKLIRDKAAASGG